MSDFNVYIIAGIGAIIAAFFNGVSSSANKWIEDIFSDFKINKAVNESVDAVEKEAKTNPDLRGQLKFQKCKEFASGTLAYKNMTVSDVVLEVKIHARLAKLDRKVK